MKFLKNSMTRLNKIKLITHDGSFHADDLFATATLSIYLENKGEAYEIIRTRDKETIEKGDYVFDVGGIYDEKNNKFDHHQANFKEKRVNGIIYSSFGLVWRKFGVEISGSKIIADFIENKLVMPVDANDNGIDLYQNNFPDILPYTLQDLLAVFSPTAFENTEKDEQFIKALAWVKEILNREIKRAKDQIEITKIIQNFYNNSVDKRLVIIEKPKVSRYEIGEALQDFPEPLFVVYGDNEDWSVSTLRKDKYSFGNRKDFPAPWAGLKDKELQEMTGVQDAVFCHKNLFLSVAKSKEGAIKLAQIAVES